MMKQTKHLFVFLMLAGIVCGQATAQRRFDASLFASPTFSQIDGDGDGSYNRLGMRGGVGTSFFFGWDERTPWRMVVELAFTQKGSTVNADGWQRRISLNYVELPVMMSYTMLANRLRIGAGVAPAILVGAKVLDNGVNNPAQEDNYRRFDRLPVLLSARYLFTDNLAVEARFSTSLLSITEQNATGTYRIFKDNKGAFNRTVSLGLAYCF